MHRTLLYSFLIGPFLTVALGCSALSGPSAPDMLLVPTESLYAPGDTVSAELVNRSDEQVGHGACALRLEHLAGGRWTLVGPEEVPCIAILYVLQPGATHVLRLHLDPTLKSGIYRLRAEILRRTSLPADYIRSPQFRLGSPA
jgi:hypothetical protein